MCNEVPKDLIAGLGGHPLQPACPHTAASKQLEKPESGSLLGSELLP